MDSSKLKEIIKQEIQANALDFLKNKEKYTQKSREKSDLDNALEEERVHNTLFYGSDDAREFEFKAKLSESSDFHGIGEVEEIEGAAAEEPQITRSEVESFEQKFKEVVTPSVKFNTGEDGAIDYRLYNGESGIEASVGGTIPLQAENYIKFDYSLQNGPFMTASVELTTDVAETISNLANFYEQWKREWSLKLGNLK